MKASYESATKYPEADQLLQGVVLIGCVQLRKTSRADAFGRPGGDWMHVDVSSRHL